MFERRCRGEVVLGLQGNIAVADAAVQAEGELPSSGIRNHVRI